MSVNWRCFHCDHVFTDRDEAAEHFGFNIAGIQGYVISEPMCRIDAAKYREMELEVANWRAENTPLQKEVNSLIAKIEETKLRYEEKGYARGLADAKLHPGELGLMPVPPRDSYIEAVKAFPLVPIRDDDHLAAAMRQIDALFRTDKDEGEDAYLDVLSDLIEKYEDVHVPIPDVARGDLLRYLIENKGSTQAKVASETGLSASTLSELVSGKRQFSNKARSILAQYFKIDESLFL